MRILLTGATSFTGFWFARYLSAAGHQLICPLRSSPDHYAGVRRARFDQLTALARIVPHAPFGSAEFISLLDREPVDLLCHHAAEVTNYKSPDFDPVRALENNTFGLSDVVAVLKAHRTRGIILTGTVFENDEGKGTSPLRAFSPYGLSKALTWQMFRFYCERAGLPLGKFVLPNPFGAFEEERFTAYLMKNWQAGNVPTVKTPDYIRDNVPADLLAAVYAQFCVQMGAQPENGIKASPSGYVESQGDFTLRVAREVRARTNWPCEARLEKQQDFSEPMERVNLASARAQVPEWNESAFWDGFVAFYSGSW